MDIAAGYALVTDTEPKTTSSSHVADVDLGVSLGVSDWLVLRGALGYGLSPVKHQPNVHIGRARVEGAYLIDIVQWVPFVGLGAGLWLVDGRTKLRPYGAGHLVFGLDYLATRSWTVGVDVRVGFLLGSGQIVNFTEGQLRLSRMFELF